MRDIRDSLAEVLRYSGFGGAADALYVTKPDAVMTIPRRLKDTRDGRESIASLVGEAFDDGIGVIVIEDE